MNHRRTGKIARLPAEVRDQVNEMINDGLEYPRIIEWLAEQGFPGFVPMNLSRWKDGGYEEWLKHQERLEELEVKIRYAAEVAHGSEGARFQQAALSLTSIQFFELLNRFDSVVLSRALAERPDKFPALINSLAKLTREVVGLERFRDQQQEKARAEAERHKPIPQGMSDETFEKILETLRMRIMKELTMAVSPASGDQATVAVDSAG
jgi:hypothetical protein